MLVLKHPEVLPLVHEISMGLFPLWLNNDGRPKLIVKVPKEAILAAHMNQGFKIYVAPIVVQNKQTTGLITAFFDDEDEPIVLFTPMFEDSDTQNLRRMLLCKELDLHFFDENNRELLGYQADVQYVADTRKLIETTEFFAFDTPSARFSLDQLAEWFRLRTPLDDRAAISVTFGKNLFPDDLLVLDLLPANHSYQGSQPFSFSELVRKEPGPYQERDIVQLLHRVFLPSQIYLGPLRVTDQKEIVDVLVMTESYALFIQAKDSPNTKQVLQNTIGRKKATAKKSLSKAANQVRGAVRYARSMNTMKMLIDGKEVELMLEGLKLRALIIVKELFNDEYSVYSPIILSLSEQIQIPCIALDYIELHMYTANLSDEHWFFKAYDTVFSHGIETGEFPRLRFGLNDDDR